MVVIHLRMIQFSKIVMTMRKLSFFAALVVAMSTVSCVKEQMVETPNENPAEQLNEDVAFNATFDAATKAALVPGESESKVEWEAGDQVSVLVGSGNYLYKAQTAGASTDLKTSVAEVPTEGTYYAVYPYNANASVVLAEETETPDSIATVLPSVQTAVLGSFSTHLAVAQADEEMNLAFKNVCGLVKVTVDAENVTKIVFEGNSGEVVAGGVNVAVSAAPAWNAIQDCGSTSISMVAASGSLEKGAYYFAVLPQTFKAGFKVTAYKGEESWVIRNVVAETTIERCAIVGSKSFFEIEGNGTEANPYILKTADHLVGMRSLATLDGETWFKMANDIDMAGVENYVPVNFDQNFRRKIHFDGGNYTISNFTSSHNGYPSLFGVLYGTVKDLKVINATINSNGHVAGIIGGYIGTSGKAAEVTNVHVQGTVTSNTTRCGGFAGNVVGAKFTDCTADVIVKGTQDVGGFVGKIQQECSFTRCSVKSQISSTHTSTIRGGCFASWANGTTVTFKDCKVLSGSKITDETGNTAAYVGSYSGFLAYAGATSKTVLENCTVDVDINLPWAQSVGGLVAILGQNELQIKGCQVDGKIVGNNQVAGALAYIEKGTNISISGTKVTASITGGTTTGCHYCAGLVGNAASLTKLNITDCSTSGDIASGGSSVAGLVGAVTNGTLTIKNSYATGSISGNNNVAGLVGNFGSAGTLENCYYKGAKIKGTSVGGLINNAKGVTSLVNCYAETNLEGAGQVGGLVATLGRDITVTKCHFSGKITSTSTYVGGMFGRSTAAVATISQSYTTGAIELTANLSNVGAIIGYGEKFVLKDSWSSMDVTSAGQAVGGLVGMMAAPSTITNCLYSGTVTGRASSGGIIGMSYTNADGNVVEGCIVTGKVVNTKTAAVQYSAGAVIGCVNKMTITAKNCWRSQEMTLSDYSGEYADGITYSNPLVDHEDVIASVPASLVPSGATNDYAQCPYHGKVIPAGTTVSAKAKAIGWDETIWDLSGATPKLK